MCMEAQNISDNLMESDNKMKHYRSGVNCALKLFGKSTAIVHNECILFSLHLYYGNISPELQGKKFRTFPTYLLIGLLTFLRRNSMNSEIMYY